MRPRAALKPAAATLAGTRSGAVPLEGPSARPWRISLGTRSHERSVAGVAWRGRRREESASRSFSLLRGSWKTAPLRIRARDWLCGESGVRSVGGGMVV